MAEGLLMRCGHAPNGTVELDGVEFPCCVICAGMRPGDTRPYTLDPKQPALEGRLARCAQCGRTEPSSTNLAFFEHVPESEFDRMYCGCKGWN